MSRVWTLARGSPDYPRGLHALRDEAPETIYGLGERSLLAALEPDCAVTIVGARRASGYGRHVAEELGRSLGAAGVLVISGMADGIDAAAHRGALAARAPTVAVLGGGPNVVYPRGQGRLYRRILEAGGAVVAELPPKTRPAKWTFPARNRIMAALAQVTIVVEAAEQSGSRITSDRALELNRTVGAVPGPVTSQLSAGTNALIYDGAHLIRDAQDVLDKLYGVGSHRVRNVGPPLDPHMAQVLDVIESGSLTADELAAATTLPPRVVAVTLTGLELSGYLRCDAGRYLRTTLERPQRW